MNPRAVIGKTAYGSLFTVALPFALWLWNSRLSCALPSLHLPWTGAVLLCLGWLFMVSGMWRLWREGGGLPMNAYPPPRVATRGIYSFIPHPIYSGCVAACAGGAFFVGSATALWIVTPLVALGCIALVLGYEAPDLRRRFGTSLPSAWLGLPGGAGQIGVWRRFGAMLAGVLPWAITYGAVKALGVSEDAFETRFPWEWSIPIVPGSMAIYASIYVVVPFTFLVCKDRIEMRRLIIGAWIAAFVNTLIYVTVPATAVFRAVESSTWLAQWLIWEQHLAAPAAGSFPSFHVTWAVLCAASLSRGRLGQVAGLWWMWCVALTLSCLTTGMHSVLDVVAGALAGLLCVAPERSWASLLKRTERLSNSWKAWRIGPMRVMNHGLWSGLAGFTVILLAGASTGPEDLAWISLVSGCALAGAGVWAQCVEGSPALLRPFGYYGSIIGGLLALGVIAAKRGPAAELLAAFALAAPWAQAIGRLRCLVQGCCHGRPVDWGIRVTNPHSRVAKLAGFAGTPVHPTALYSILANIVIGMLLLRMRVAGSGAMMLAGIYLVLAGLSRFAEEAYRGEPQTLRFAALPLYQWMAIGSLLVGMAIMVIPAPPLPAITPPGTQLWLAAVSWGLICAFAMSMDFPASNRRFSRLTG